MNNRIKYNVLRITYNKLLSIKKGILYTLYGIRYTRPSGFTLIEVLVVATIIGILATVGFAGFQAVTRSSRDALRRSDLEQIRSALEIYNSETGAYPAATNCVPVIPTSYIVPPSDPKSSFYKYCYQPTALTYKLCAHLENGSGTDDLCSPPTNQCTSNCNYVVTNP
jgi:prepilin-type N-terminal cleavage/methylation domain-containing protein